MMKKLQKTAVLMALLTLMFAITAVSCVDPDPGGGGDDDDDDDGGTTGLSGKWVHQNENTFVVLEFTSNQLKISDTGVTIFYKDTDGEIKTGSSSSSITEVFCDSYDITAGVLTFTGGTSATSYSSANFYRVNTLSNNQWKDGAITSDSKGQVWYSFNVTDGTTYRMWWNDSYEGGLISNSGGNGIKTLNISVSGYYNSGSSAFYDINTAWGTARSFTPNASQAGTFYVKVTPFSSTGVPTGTFALIYSTTAITRPSAPFNPSATALTANQWKDGEITAASNGAVWYSFSVSTGTIYNVWWNENGSNGNGTKTLNVSVKGFYSNGDDILGFSTTTTAWSTAQFFTPTKSGTVYLKVTPNTSGETGTFGIVYNTGLNADKPGSAFNPPNTIPLTADEWTDGAITSGSNGEAWYSLTVTAGTYYYFWWNENGGYNTGDGFKTLNIRVSAFNNEGTAVSSFTNIDTAWGTVKTFIPTADGTVYLKVTPYTSGGTGTYGIVYSETNSRPVAPPFNPPNSIALTTNVWADGEITTGSSGEVWYSFAVTSGTTYRVWWNEKEYGNGLKTLNIFVSGYYSDGSNISAIENSSTAWTNAKTFTPTVNDTVYIRIRPDTATGGNGTFGIVYSDNSTTRPPLPVTLPSNTTPLTANTWADDTITSSIREVWYSFDVTSESTYQVWWNESSSPGTIKTLNITVSAWYGNGTNIFEDENEGWNNAKSFTPDANGTVYVKVTTNSSNANGTFGIAYNIDPAVRPLVPINPVSPTALTLDTWTDGAITTAGGEVWYSFAVTSGTNYYFWLNEAIGNFSNGNRLKTLDVNVTFYYANGTYIRDIGSAWSSSTTITSAANDTIYIKITAANSGSTGTFGVVYSETTTRPALSFTPPSLTSLTADEWADGTITTVDGEVWYSLTVSNNTTYSFWWNEGGSNGNGFKTADVRVSAWYSDWTLVSDLNNVDTAWSSRAYFISNQAGTIYIRVTAPYSFYVGTFGIVYSTTNTRPPVPFDPPNPIALTADQWMDGDITTADGEVWYSLTVSGSTTYYVWWNESGSYGNGMKTADVRVSAWYSDGTLISNLSNYDFAWSTARSFTPNTSQAGTVYIRVTPFSSESVGTFGIVYSTTSTRPPAPFDPPNPTTLTVDVWTAGNIPTSSGEQWFTFTATASTQYIHVIFGTLNDLYVQVYDSSGSTVGVETELYNNTRNINRSLTLGQDYYIRVRPYYSGAYQIAFNASSTAPSP